MKNLLSIEHLTMKIMLFSCFLLLISCFSLLTSCFLLLTINKLPLNSPSPWERVGERLSSPWERVGERLSLPLLLLMNTVVDAERSAGNLDESLGFISGPSRLRLTIFSQLRLRQVVIRVYTYGFESVRTEF